MQAAQRSVTVFTVPAWEPKPRISTWSPQTKSVLSAPLATVSLLTAYVDPQEGTIDWTGRKLRPQASPGWGAPSLKHSASFCSGPNPTVLPLPFNQDWKTKSFLRLTESKLQLA